jgi:uncharacterized protein YbjT (DUF2867 family)
MEAISKVEGALEKAAMSLAHVGEALGIPNLDPSSGKIFVTGGSGPVGHRVALRLLNAGYPTVRVGVPHVDAAEGLNKLGAETADFDWQNDATYAHALDGVRSVMCTAPYVEKWAERFPNFLEACKKAGVKHIVKVSFYHARASGDVFQDVPLVRAHGDCDELLTKSGISYTILAATHFMSNPFVFQGQELRKDQKPATFYGASAGKGVNYVSPNDVAEVAVRALLEPKAHHNKEYVLTGPEAITDQTVADLISKHLDKPIMYVDQPVHTFEDEEKMGGDPEWKIKDLVALEKIKASGKEEDASFVSKDIETICGRKAETFEEYLLVKDYMTSVESA